MFDIQLLKTPCGRTPAPPSFGTFEKNVPEEPLRMFPKSWKNEAESVRESNKSLLKNDLKMHRKLEKIKVWRGSGSSWEPPWDENSKKTYLGRFWPILAGLGKPKMTQVGAKLAPQEPHLSEHGRRVAAKMGLSWPTWCPRWPTWEHLGSILAPLSENLKNL